MFDWTGTLVNEYKLDKNVCKKMEYEISKKEGIKPELARKKYLELLNSLEDRWEWYNYPLHAQILGIDWKPPQLSELSKLKIVPKAIDVLSHYRKKGHHIFLLTNAVKSVIDLRIDYLKLRKYFDLVVTTDMVESTKASGKHFEYALRYIDSSTKKIYMIGDSYTQDIFPAKRFGIIAIQCKFGKGTYFHTNNNNEVNGNPLVFPDFIIHNLEELFEIIL